MGLTSFQPLHNLSAAIDRLTAHARDWPEDRLLDEGLDLIRDASWADSCALLRVEGDRVRPVHRRPAAPVEHAAPGGPVPVDWFPWGLAPVQPDRYLMVGDAAGLPLDPDGRVLLGDLGVRSCLHLPLRERDTTVGALQVFWNEPRLVWDDSRGGPLRTLGQFLLARSGPGRDPRTGAPLD
jgi:GAF domain-containing protein